MGAGNHPTVQVETDDNQTAVPSVNGHALDSLVGVEAAFDYLADDYNDGDITWSLDKECLLVTARARRFQHLNHLLDVHASDATPVYVADVYAAADGRQRVEIKEE